MGFKTSNFQKLQSFKTDYAPTTITQYESQKSGMRVIVADRKGPKINGYFTLATEILDDSGAPHTLEHLVFMGSRSYPYKGLLDKLAGRAYSSTNAWTAVDHTAYTLETAGWDGFAQILPVYLEHVILPTITDEGCLTEVHHVDGEGNDAGVVYSEMQALENDAQELTDLQARRLLYPKDVGFRYETGGMMEALRVLTPERIRQFHRDMYQPKNMAVVIIGEVDHDHLLSILDEFETSIEKDIPSASAPFDRPWITSAQPPPIKDTVVNTIDFPEEDESVGEILIAFFGPSVNDVLHTTALSVLLTYLCGSSVSILENIIVEKEELASSVGQWWDGRPNSVIWFQPTGVATEKLEHVEKRVHELLAEVASKPLDMTYLTECIARERRQVKFQAESSESFYSSNLITDYLFGNRDGSTLASLRSLGEYDELEKFTDSQWRDFLKQWLVDAKHISVIGKPSAALAKQIKDAEETRLAQRKQDLGQDGLRKLAEKLEAAKLANEIAIPDTLLDKWPVPGTESIHFIKSTTARSGKAKALGTTDTSSQQLIDSAKQGQPLFVQFEDIPSNFVTYYIHVETSSVPVKLKPLIALFIDNFFNSPITRDGKKVDFETIVMELEKDTISYTLTGGGRVGDPESLVIQFQTEPDKYAKIIEWIRALMFDSIFDPIRIKAAISKQLADIPEAKRDGRTMANEVEMDLHSKKEWLPMARRVLVKAVYLKRLKKALARDPELVVSWFEDLRASLFTFANTRVLVAADIEKLDEPVASWDVLAAALLFSSSSSSSASSQSREQYPDPTPIPKSSSFLSAEGHSPGQAGTILIPIPTLDSSYSISTTIGLQSPPITSTSSSTTASAYTSPDLPAFLVAISYLEAVEGPLWTAVRGNGLAYGVHFGRDIDSNLLQFKVYRSPDASKAISAAKIAVARLASGEQPLDRHLLEGAVSGIVMGFADEQATMAGAASQNYVNGVVRGLPPRWTEDVLEKVRRVAEGEVRAVLRDVVMPVFEAGRSNVVVACQPLKQEEMDKSFRAMGYKTQTKQLADFYDDYGLEDMGDDGDDAEMGSGSDEEEEEDDDNDDENGSGSESGQEDDESIEDDK